VGSDSIRELVLDLVSVECHTDDPRCLRLGTDHGFDLDPRLDFVDGVQVLIEQVVDQCLEKPEELEVSLLMIVVEEEMFDSLVERLPVDWKTFDPLVFGLADHSETFDYLALESVVVGLATFQLLPAGSTGIYDSAFRP